VLWSQRHVLPLASPVGVGGRRDIPLAMRKRYEQAQALHDEAARLQRRHFRDLERTVPAEEREALDRRLNGLREAMEAQHFDRAHFESSFAKAEEAVETTLARWRKGELREYGESIAIAVAVALLLLELLARQAPPHAPAAAMRAVLAEQSFEVRPPLGGHG